MQFPRSIDRALAVELFGNDPCDRIEVVVLNDNVSGGLNGCRVKVVFEAAFGGEHRVGAWATIHQGGRRLPMLRFRWELVVVKVEFGNPQRRESVCPGLNVPAAEGNENQVAFVFPRSQVGQFRVFPRKHSADSP